MSTIKTITTTLTAAALVTGIGLAWAQTDDRSQPANTPTATGAMPSTQTPADSTTTPSPMQQQTPATDPSRTTPPVDSTATPLPSDARTMQDNTTNSSNRMGNSNTANNSNSSNYPGTSGTRAVDELAPRTDRN